MGHLTRRHRSIIGIDPGETRTGWSVFFDGVLWQAGTVTAKTLDDLPEVPLLPAIVVVEQPVIYVRGRGSKGDPNDLVTLALFAGRIAGRFEIKAPGVEVEFVTPRRWKGTVPKNITNKRTVAALDDEEREKLPRRPRARDFDHNMLDGVGIALWQAQREKWRS